MSIGPSVPCLFHPAYFLPYFHLQGNSWFLESASATKKTLWGRKAATCWKMKGCISGAILTLCYKHGQLFTWLTVFCFTEAAQHEVPQEATLALNGYIPKRPRSKFAICNNLKCISVLFLERHKGIIGHNNPIWQLTSMMIGKKK